ncbi:centrosomal protein 131 [Phyllostomus discolor]|uniref:Centrosomal protein 131 n=1 Tax=Phyllostomus discolor TaxID=89673 RepID=A0A833ZFG0_9CHIR|nr:centrosomal protein 131 [Phyllostomus discolor]
MAAAWGEGMGWGLLALPGAPATSPYGQPSALGQQAGVGGTACPSGIGAEAPPPAILLHLGLQAPQTAPPHVRRVKAALARKEEAVNSLRKQHEAAVRRADHLEELLQQRRRPLRSAK